MSLRVWLPLTKDLRNQGLDDVTVTNNGATFNSAGKLGGCYTFDGTDDFINLGNISSYFTGSTHPFSICFWIYSSESGTRGVIFSSYGLTSTSNFFSLEINSGSVTNNSLRFDWKASPDWASDVILTPNTWIHVGITYDGTLVKFYKNGELIQTKSQVLSSLSTNNNWYLGRDSRTGTTAFNGKLNDFRIYDHVLSQMEVKQLSQGLVLRYPLNRQGFGQENLGNTSATYSNYTNGQTVSAGSWGGDTGTVTYYHSGGYNNYPYKVYHKTATGSGGIYRKTENDIDIKANTTYTMSIYVKASRNFSDVAYSFNINRGSDNYYITFGKNIQFTTEWKRIVKTFTTDENAAGKYGEMSIIYDDTVTDYYVYYSGFKIEEGSIATPWCPSSSDALATTMGLNSITEYDCSGFCNNGTRTGTFTWTSDTPKYTVSTIFAYNENKIQHPQIYFSNEALPSLTISMWAKVLESSQTSISLHRGFGSLLFGTTNKEIQLGFKREDNTLGLFTVQLPSTINIKDWMHITLCYVSKTSFTLYVNGSFLKNFALDVDIYTRFSSSTIGNSDCQISDFRIYATALSASDVKSLYQNCATIDADGTIHGQIR